VRGRQRRRTLSRHPRSDAAGTRETPAEFVGGDVLDADRPIRSGPERGSRLKRRMVLILGGALVLGVAVAGRNSVTASFTTLGSIQWPWLVLAVLAELTSMAAFARAPATPARVRRRTDTGTGDARNHLRVECDLRLAAKRWRDGGHDVCLPPAECSRRRAADDDGDAGDLRARSHHLASRSCSQLQSYSQTTQLPRAQHCSEQSSPPSFRSWSSSPYGAPRRALRCSPESIVRVAASRRRFGRPRGDVEAAVRTFAAQLDFMRLGLRHTGEVLLLALWNWLADALCLAAAIRATGAPLPWHSWLLAYAVGVTSANLALTPGGIGFIEVALAAALVGAGLNSSHAVAAALAYRAVSFWLVIAIGWAVVAALARARSIGPLRTVRSTTAPELQASGDETEAIAVSAGVPFTYAGTWKLDPSKTSVRFRTKAAWAVPVRGTAKAVRGEALVGPEGDAHGRLVVDAGSFFTRNKKRDEDLRSTDFFDVDRSSGDLIHH